ncbi:hypothetical protein [Acetobacter estunensis]|uniref:hypothetical protein n=1 Tax=Acetobacter estunensis TaxID=104097 RepID=UPI001C2D99E8|nr:hypothetical protein [Acetobacter estunensis]MBV1835636.1 hypothetical protein [Acetobacter estunensis]MBV1836103.1 hypothetical protein [Acetobacter estunensis]
MAKVQPRKFGAAPRKRPYSIPRRPLDLSALKKGHVPADLDHQVRVSGGMTRVDPSLMKWCWGLWYV